MHWNLGLVQDGLSRLSGHLGQGQVQGEANDSWYFEWTEEDDLELIVRRWNDILQDPSRTKLWPVLIAGDLDPDDHPEWFAQSSHFDPAIAVGAEYLGFSTPNVVEPNAPPREAAVWDLGYLAHPSLEFDGTGLVLVPSSSAVGVLFRWLGGYPYFQLAQWMAEFDGVVVGFAYQSISIAVRQIPTSAEVKRLKQAFGLLGADLNQLEYLEDAPYFWHLDFDH
jgi:hypothetical protein